MVHYTDRDTALSCVTKILKINHLDYASIPFWILLAQIEPQLELCQRPWNASEYDH